jgi:hypothetical protein
VIQEISREPSQQQPVPASEIRPRSTVAGKRLLALLAIGLPIVLTLAIHPSFIKATWAGITRILYAENTPPPPALLNNAKRAMQSPAPAAIAPQSRSDPPTADAEVQKLWTDFEMAAWGASLQDWSALHPEIPCAPFRGNMWSRGADAQWAQQCSIRTERQAAAHWSFYIFSLEEPLASRLEQFDETTLALPEDTLKQVQQSLQSQSRSPLRSRRRSQPQDCSRSCRSMARVSALASSGPRDPARSQRVRPTTQRGPRTPRSAAPRVARCTE